MVNAGTKILGRNQFVIGQGTGGECHDVGSLTVHAFELRLKVLIIVIQTRKSFSDLEYY